LDLLLNSPYKPEGQRFGDKTMMVFGDAKKVIEDMVKAVE
jgi:hypothetical protein